MEFVWSESGDPNYAEKETWKALKVALAEDEGICYHRYPIFSADRSRREPDILILHRKRAIRKPDVWYHDGDHAVLMRSTLVCHDVRCDPLQPRMRPI